MIPIISLLFILCVSLVVTRVATVALTLTGMQRDVARFQARSAFTGAGFTTSESERIVNHPVRRKIIMQLMLYGHVDQINQFRLEVNHSSEESSVVLTQPE